jgi:peptide deformylase
MIKEIIKDENVLKQVSEPFVFGEDDELIQDLLETAEAHRENCAGLASIQIGVAKKVILVRNNEDKFLVFINPSIIKKSPKTYITEEGCLSLEGLRQVKRHFSIKVIWTTLDGKTKAQEFNGRMAQILQHEIDHCKGVLI